MEEEFLTPTLIEAAMEEEFLTLTLIEAAMEEEFLGLKLIEAEVSNILPNECGGRVEDGVDRISQLPDEILVDILSFLSLKEAAATSVLSSRWSNLWKYTTNLNFNDFIVRDDVCELSDIFMVPEAQRCKCIERVNSVIKSHKALSLNKFRIFLNLRKSDKWAVTKWLEFAFSRQVESLELEWFCYEEDKFVLGELLRESRICLQPQTDLIFFQSLKSLCLHSLKVSGEDIELFLRNCPLLEKLSTDRTTLTSDVELCGANLMLKHLIIMCNGQKSIKISAPNLCTMVVDEGAKLFLENLPKLVKARFMVMRPDIDARHFAFLESCYFPQLQFLEFPLFDSKILFQLQQILANGFRQMPNLKKLDISCFRVYNHNPLLPAIALLWAFPRLEEFKLRLFGSREEQPAYMQEVMTDTGRSLHQHLKVFQLQICLQQKKKICLLQDVRDDIVELVTYLSNNCVALRKIIIGGLSNRNDPANMDYLTQQLQGKVANHIQLDLFNSWGL